MTPLALLCLVFAAEMTAGSPAMYMAASWLLSPKSIMDFGVIILLAITGIMISVMVWTVQ